MEWLKEYVRHAKECREAAAMATNREVRDHLLRMADRWEELVRQRAAYMHLEDALATLLQQDNGNQSGGNTAA